MATTDWRSWAAQQGGMLPTAPNPPGDPRVPNTMFPGVLPITDKISGSTSVPAYDDTPTTRNAVDPFGGWTAQSTTMRPVVPGLTA